MRTGLTCVVAFWFLSSSIACEADEPKASRVFKDRLESYFLEMENFPAVFSVEIASQYVESIPEDDYLGSRSDYGFYMADRLENRVRYHARISLSAGTFHEHVLQELAKQWRATGLNSDGNIVESKIIRGQNMYGSIPFRVLPFTVPVNITIGGDTEREKSEHFFGAKVIQEGNDDDGKYVATILYQSGLGGTRITFRNEPDWLPESMVLFTKKLENPVDLQTTTIDDIVDWSKTGSTTTEWEEMSINGLGVWIPMLITANMGSTWDEDTTMFEAKFT